MRLLPILVFSLAPAAWAVEWGVPLSRVMPPPVRTIKMCVINDSDQPVQAASIESVLDVVIAEYKDNVQISFERGARISASIDVSAWPLDLGMWARRVCGDDDEIRVLFTNQRLMGDDLPPGSMLDRSKGTELAGSSHPYFGYAMLLNVDARMKVSDRAGNPAPVTALKHEFGHLFAVEHSTDDRSFMFTPSSRSLAAWTVETIGQIQSRRHKTWFPNASKAAADTAPAYWHD